MPSVATPVTVAGSPSQATISADGTYVQFAVNSQWIDGCKPASPALDLCDPDNDTPAIKPGDLVYYVGNNGNAIQTVTSVDLVQHRIYFAPNDAIDFFHFNQPSATVQAAGTGRPLALLKDPTLTLTAAQAWQVNPSSTPVTLFKALMITYYVDAASTPGTPRLTRQLNSCPTGWTPATVCAFAPQALAGVVEDLDLTYDLYDGVVNPTNVTGFPYLTYSENQIRKVNLHVGVRSETISKPVQDYVRNHITTSVNVRSLAAVDKYPS
jgi:hypothetical protein